MNHPGIAGDNNPFWYGPEVEGPLALWRVHSVFIAQAIAPHDLAAVDEANVSHVFLCATMRDWVWFEGILVPWLVARRLPLTMECHAEDPEDVAVVAGVRQSSVPDARLVLRYFVHRDALRHLGLSDLVSVGAPYDLATFVLGEGVRTVPADFEEDEVPS